VIRGGAIAFLLALASPAAALGGPYAFGRESGNIVPFTVTIAQNGVVHVTGPVRVGRTRLTASQLATVAAVVAKERLATLPATTACPGTLPDIASTWVRAGSHRVQVHGSCSTRFTRVWNALTAAVRLSYG
jgi:hypothetical protein